MLKSGGAGSALGCLLAATLLSSAYAQSPPAAPTPEIKPMPSASPAQPESTPPPFPTPTATPPQALPPGDLRTFAAVLPRLVELRKEAKSGVAEAIAADRLTIARYLEIRQARQKNHPDARSDISPEEIQQFLAADQKVGDIRRRLEAQMQKQLTAAGMKPDRFRRTFVAIQQDRQLQQQLRRLLQAAGESARDTSPTDETDETEPTPQ